MDRNIYSPAITKQLNLHSIRSQANIRPTLLAMMRTLPIVVLIALLGETTAVFSQTYSMYVANESDDTVMLIQFDGKELSILETVTVGTIHTEIEGPHGLAVDLDGKHWIVSIAHGQPFGKVVRYSTTDNRPTGTVTLGMFPASMAVSSQTGLLYVANFNLHGNPEPSSISVVDPDAMLEVGRITTGIMPHGSAFGPDGRRHYSVAMMNSALFELDALNLNVIRDIPLGQGAKPTWVSIHPDEPLAYVAANGADQILIVDTEAGRITARLNAPGAPYNLAVSPDGKTLVATLKGAQAVSIFDLSTGTERARVPSSQPVTHGVIIAPDNQYAFVTSEGIGATPGAVDVINLTTAARIASLQAGQQTGGIAFWRITD